MPTNTFDYAPLLTLLHAICVCVCVSVAIRIKICHRVAISVQPSVAHKTTKTLDVNYTIQMACFTNGTTITVHFKRSKENPEERLSPFQGKIRLFS